MDEIAALKKQNAEQKAVIDEVAELQKQTAELTKAQQ